ncbi:MAG: Crp/Fnr family transcriptional regulator [Solidesulfovibrio sp.]
MTAQVDSPKGFIVEGANLPWESILRLGERRLYRAGQQVSMPMSDAEQGFYYLKKGSVRLTYTSSFGNEMIQLIIRSGMIFNEITALQHLKPTAVCFYCHADVEAYFFHRSVVFCPEFVREYPSLILNLMESMTAKSSLFFYHSCALGMFNAFHNTCRAIYFLWERQGKKAEFAPGLTHGDLAAHLGIHRASLHKILRRLIDEGIIGGYTCRKMTVLDAGRLEAYALSGEDETD